MVSIVVKLFGNPGKAGLIRSLRYVAGAESLLCAAIINILIYVAIA